MSEKSQNKVRFYLDQNVIDYIIKGNLDDIKELISHVEDSEIIYSHVTLREFARIENDLQRRFYLDYLRDVNAKYFCIDDNELAQFEDIDPFEIYSEINSPNKVYKSVGDSMFEMLHKLLGGNKDFSFDEIALSQKDSFSQLMKILNENLDHLEENPFIDKEVLKRYIPYMDSYFTELIDKITIQLKNINFDKGNPLINFRKFINIKVDKLNDIEPPNVIDQIWERIKNGIISSNINLTYNDLFGDGFNKFYPYQKITMSMKVNRLYNILNSIGYYHDKNIHNENKLIPFINDQQHVGYAMYSNFFVTRDKRLMKKTEAVYEHLKIGTKIIFIH